MCIRDSSPTPVITYQKTCLDAVTRKLLCYRMLGIFSRFDKSDSIGITLSGNFAYIKYNFCALSKSVTHLKLGVQLVSELKILAILKVSYCKYRVK